jgi:hypothetical protein
MTKLQVVGAIICTCIGIGLGYMGYNETHQTVKTKSSPKTQYSDLYKQPLPPIIVQRPPVIVLIDFTKGEPTKVEAMDYETYAKSVATEAFRP